MRVCSVLLFLAIIVSASGQTLDNRSDTDIILNDLNRLRSKSAYGNVEGSPFLFDDWKAARVFMGALVFEGRIQIDLISNDLFVQKEQNEYLIPSNTIKEIKLIEKNQVYWPLKYKNQYEFFCVLFKGEKIQLLRLTEKSIKAGNEFDRQSTIHQTESYFLRNEKNLYPVKSRHDFYKLIPERKKSIDSLISKEKLNLKSESGLTQMVIFLNSH